VLNNFVKVIVVTQIKLDMGVGGWISK